MAATVTVHTGVIKEEANLIRRLAKVSKLDRDYREKCATPLAKNMLNCKRAEFAKTILTDAKEVGTEGETRLQKYCRKNIAATFLLSLKGVVHLLDNKANQCRTGPPGYQENSRWAQVSVGPHAAKHLAYFIAMPYFYENKEAK
ncbi:hypothetical protein XELAEV_18020084mg [Xenopus laevis]|uniref:Uncharacterized protein n=1 Tax=Xenopus laevis TaxID=8355 RepID=A0A974HQ55_XENLA|nr:hypothetical protein XELAEV_18020084mg [Xenopus laevis]